MEAPLFTEMSHKNHGGFFSWLGGGSKKNDHCKSDHGESDHGDASDEETSSPSHGKSNHYHHHSGILSEKESEYKKHTETDEDEGDTSNSTRSEGDASEIESDEDSEEKQKRINMVQLPSEIDLNDIFEKMSNFTLKKVMAKDITDPKSNWTYNTKGAVNTPKFNPLDQYLEENIKMLFDPAKFDISDIKDVLCYFVKNPDLHTASTVEHKRFKDGRGDKLKHFKTQIKIFYPHLLKAMKALVVYTKQNENTKGNEKEEEYDKHAFSAWKEVFGYLKSIQLVISFVMKDNSITMDKYPVEFSDIILKRENDLKTLNEVLMNHRGAIQKLEESRLERDKKVAELNSIYNGVDSRIADLQAQTINIQSQIRDVDSPIIIAKQNIDCIKNIS